MIGVTNIPDVARIIVTAPAGTNAVIKLSGTTIDSASISSGSTTCSLTVRKTSSNYSLEATYDGTTITHTININRLGKKYYDEFTFIAYIIVTTFPGASVSATGPATIASQTADNSGVCTLTVPTGGRGNYNVTSSYSSWSTTQSDFSVSSYNSSFPVTIDLSVPVFTFTPSGGSAVTIGINTTTGSGNGYYYYRSGANWEFYALSSGTLSIANRTNTDLFLCGAGSNGGNGSAGGRSWYDEYAQKTYYQGTSCSGGSAGFGGYRRKHTAVINGSLTVTCGSSNGANSSIGSYSSSGGTRSGESENGGYSFDDSSAKGPDGNSRRVGAGGGKGAQSSRGGGSSYSSTNGGDYGGGDGGTANASGTAGTCYPGDSGNFYGAGGGGGGAWCNFNQTTLSNQWGDASGGTGYRGFAAIRNKR